jgi:hypothetical protein
MDDNIIYQRALYITPRKFFITKLCLRAASLVSGVVVMALVFWLLSYDASLPALILGPPVRKTLHHTALGPKLILFLQTALSLCWSFSELICLFVRYGHNGIDPGAIVGCDLILWLGLITTTILTRLTRDGFYFEYPHANSKYASWGRRSAFYAGLAFAAANT